MKRILSVFVILMSMGQIYCFSQHSTVNGWIQEECGLISNADYHFENYVIPPHGGAGYKLYHYGNIIYQEEYFMYGYEARELKFIDDTTGFFIVLDRSGPGFLVYKIINDSVIYIGNCPGDQSESFVVSRHTNYVASYYMIYGIFCITRFSDLMPRRELLYTNIIVPDTTFHDTVSGIPLCQDLNELDYLNWYNSDSLIYAIKFSTDTLSSIFQKNESSCFTAPNPASEFIHIISPLNQKIKSITILDNPGRITKYLKSDNTGEQVIYIGDLYQGVYFLIIEYGIKKKVIKFIKI